MVASTPEALTYTLVNGPLSRVVFTLDATQLRVRGPMRNVDVPVATLDAFYVKPMRIDLAGPRTAVANAMMTALPFDAHLWVSWSEAGARRHRKLEIQRADPACAELLQRLATLRPSANLLGLHEDEARRRMGMMSRQLMALLAVVGVIAALAIALGIAALARR